MGGGGVERLGLKGLGCWGGSLDMPSAGMKTEWRPLLHGTGAARRSSRHPAQAAAAAKCMRGYITARSSRTPGKGLGRSHSPGQARTVPTTLRVRTPNPLPLQADSGRPGPTVTYPIPHPFMDPSAPSAAPDLLQATERRYARMLHHALSCVARPPGRARPPTRVEW